MQYPLCSFTQVVILREQMSVYFSRSGLHILNSNVSNYKKAPSLNKILAPESALMEAAWAVSRISDELQPVSNSMMQLHLHQTERRGSFSIYTGNIENQVYVETLHMPVKVKVHEKLSPQAEQILSVGREVNPE